MAEQCGPPWPGEAHPGATNVSARFLSPVCGGGGGVGGHLFIYLFLMLSAPKVGYRTGFPSTRDSLSFCERRDPERGSFVVVLMVLKPDNVPSSVRHTGRRESPSTQGDSRVHRFRRLSASFLLISSRRQNRPSSTEVPLAQTQHVCHKQACAWTWTSICSFLSRSDLSDVRPRPQRCTEYSSHAASQGRPPWLARAGPRPSCAWSGWEETAWPRGARELLGASSPHCRLPIPNTCPPFFMLNRLFMARDRQTDLTDIWKHLSGYHMACLSPVVRYTKIIITVIIIIIIMDGGLSHIKCGKSNFIFVFSNNNIDKKIVCERFPSSTVVQKLMCLSGKINKINWIVILLVFTVSFSLMRIKPSMELSSSNAL